jgi:23S rRNA pseudouridine2605 synthase
MARHFQKSDSSRGSARASSNSSRPNNPGKPKFKPTGKPSGGSGGGAGKKSDRFKRPARPGQTFEFTSPPKPSPATKKRSGGTIPDELKDASRGIRLQKYLAEAGVGSRRLCEELIAEGLVRVNRQEVTALPAWVNPFVDDIEVRGEMLPRPKGSEKIRHIAREKAGGEEDALPYVPEGKALFEKTYIVLYKPRQVITSTNDPEGRPTVMDLVKVPHSVAARLFPVGRLDIDSTGLVLITNDGELAQRLTHPMYGVQTRYHVAFKGKLTEEEMHRIHQAVDRGKEAPAPTNPDTSKVSDLSKLIRPQNVKLLGHQRDQTKAADTKVEITLQEGQSREIRKVLAHIELKVKKIQRIGIGPLTLKGLNAWDWRHLSEQEVHDLKKSITVKRPPSKKRRK